ncbi:MAG TPA: hypothetical protein VGC76_00105 [Pyrinomonadaceae bacterium]|jgi:hypothetical protein
MELFVKRKKILLVPAYAFLLSGCFLNAQSDVLSQNYAKTSITKLRPELTVTSLCELYDKPYLYHNKVVKLKTTLYRIADTTSLGDINCVQRHSLVDVEFSPEFESSVCEPKNDFREELCAIAKATKQNEEGVNLEISADIIGYFNYYQTEQGFTSNGLRFRFYVQKIEDIKKITPVAVEKLH